MREILTHELTPESIAALGKEEKHWCYNGLDCMVTAEVFGAIRQQLDPVTERVYAFEKALQGPVLEMKLRGVLVDQKRRAEVIADFEEKLHVIEHNLHALVCDGVGYRIAPADPANPKTAKGEFNWRSPDQIKKLFYEVMQFPAQKTKGSVTVDRDALERLKSYLYAEPIISHLLALRDLGKKIGVLKTNIDDDGRIRTSYNIAGTDTGRFSSNVSDFGTGTNLQNIEDSLRTIFVADPGYKFAYIDLAQAESRAVGAICWNLFHRGAYLDACESGDLHTTVTRLARKGLPWTGDLAADKAIAEMPGYRHLSYRDLSKKLGHGCLTFDHEVLTPSGWVPIWTKPKTIMTWGEETSYFTQVSHWVDKKYSGTLQQFEGSSISVLMTHDHRVPYKSDREGPLKERPAEAGPGTLMPLGNGFDGGHIAVPGALIAAIMSDGHRSSNKSFVFNLVKERKRTRLLQLCKEADVNCYVRQDGRIVVNYNCDKEAGPYMLNWSKQSLKDFLSEYKFWDGTQGKASVTLFAKNKKHLEWIQTIGRLMGIGGQISKPYTTGFGGTCYRLQQNNRQWASGKSISHSRHLVVERNVYCPTVETGWFYVRRNGKIFVTGNTNYYGKPPTMARHSKLPVNVIAEFQGDYFTAFPEIPMWHADVSRRLKEERQLVSLSGRRRHFFSRPDDDSTLRAAIAFDPQGSVGDILNQGMLQVWRTRLCHLLMQIHDAILVQYPEHLEDKILPLLIQSIAVPVPLLHGRTMTIPSDAQVGWNFGKFKKGKNEDGLLPYSGTDSRRRQRQPETRRLVGLLG